MSPRTRLTASSLLLTGALGLLTTPALAQDKPRLVVVFTSADGVDSRLGRDLQETTLSALSDEEQRYTLTGREELARLGDFPSAEALDACLGEPGCAAQLRQKFTVEVLVQGHVEMSEDSYIIHLRALEQDRDPHTLTQTVDQSAGLDQLLETVFLAAAGLNFPTSAPPPDPPVEITKPEEPPVTQNPPPPIIEPRGEGISASSIVGYSLLGLSALSLGAGIYFDLSGDAAYDTLAESNGDIERERAEALWSDVDNDASLSNVFYAGALGAGLIGAGLVAYELFDDGNETTTRSPTLQPFASPSAAGVTLDARF